MINTGLDINGYIVNQSSYKLISQDYKIVLDYNIEQFKTNKPIDTIHSIYVYGSIAKGNAVKFKSDLDLIIITIKELDTEQNKLIESIKQKTLNKFNYLTKIDMPVCQLEKIKLPENIYDIAFRIKNSSVCIYGIDISDSIDKFKPTKEVAFAFNHEIYELLDKYKEYFNKVTDEKILILLSKQISKKIIRSIFGSIIEEKQIWCDSFEEMSEKYLYFYPEETETIIKLTKIAREGTIDKTEVLILINKFEVRLKAFYLNI